MSWPFNWTAPEDGSKVIFNVAVNAGNCDDSSSGGWIYAKEITLKAAAYKPDPFYFNI